MTAHWRVPGDLGRRYAAVSGDRNPIHLHALSAKAFGFPRAIAHGMWTKARCLAALRLPDALTAEVRFKQPILLPSTVTFGEADDRFAVHSHLEEPWPRTDDEIVRSEGGVGGAQEVLATRTTLVVMLLRRPSSPSRQRR